MRRRETDEARAERLRANRKRKATRRQQETTQAREARCVCIRPGLCLCLCVSVLRALVACKKSLVAKEFSQHRHRSFRLVIASLQIGPTEQRRAQLKHLETTLRTPPAHTRTGCGRTDKDKLRGASARRRRCSSRDAARSCDQINCKKEYYRLSSTWGAPRNQHSVRGRTRLTTVTSISCRSF